MRSLFVALIIASVTVFGSIEYTRHLEKISAQMMEQNQEIEKDIMAENYDAASQKTKRLSDFIEEKRSLLDAVGNHQELDEIERNLAELVSFTDDHMHGEALSKCYSLEFLIRALPRNFRIKVENIL